MKTIIHPLFIPYRPRRPVPHDLAHIREVIRLAQEDAIQQRHVWPKNIPKLEERNSRATKKAVKIVQITIIAFILLTSQRVFSTTNTWVGGHAQNPGQDKKWSQSDNWGNNTLPVWDGTADIVFALSFLNGATATDLSGSKSIRSLTITTDTAFSIDTSASILTLYTGNITRTGSGTVTFSAGIALGGGTYSGIWSNANPSGELAILAPISQTGGTRDLIITGDGLTRFGGTTANTYTGDTTVKGGTLVLGKTAGINAIAGNLVIGDETGADTVRLNAANQIIDTASITINSSGFLNLNNFSETIASVFMSAGSISTGTGTLTFGGNLTGKTNAASATITGNLNLGGTARTFNIADGLATVDMLIGASIANGGLIKTGAGTLVLSGPNTYSAGTTVSNGTLRVNNTSGSGTGSGPLGVEAGGTLGGTGIVAGAVTIRNGGTLAPGNSVGTLTLGSLTLDPGSDLQIEIQDAFTFDKLVLSGGVSLGGKLDLIFLNGFVPSSSNTFTIITAPGGISGNFAAVTPGYQVGIVGNDVIVTSIPEPSAFVLAGSGILLFLFVSRRRR
jgi:fibronectin-binding autotransporter adhesin